LRGTREKDGSRVEEERYFHRANEFRSCEVNDVSKAAIHKSNGGSMDSKE
jgi:hypothetical protein